MSDFDNLREKVEQTAGRLTAAQADRERRTNGLLEMLGQLEERFNVQEEQLAHYRERVAPLEESNLALSDLMTKLMTIVDAQMIADEDDPLTRATDVAARMLSDDMGGATPVEDDSEIRFEDVSPEMLAAEAEAEEAAIEQESGNEQPEAISDAEIEALAVSVGSSGAEMSVEIDAPADAPPADAEALIAEEIAAQDLPPEIAEAEVAEAEPEEAVAEATPEPAVEAEMEAEAEDSENLVAELDIPEPDAAIAASAETEVAAALEQALNTMAGSDDVPAAGSGEGKPDIRELLKRVEQAALKAQALTGRHAGEEAEEVEETEASVEPEQKTEAA